MKENKTEKEQIECLECLALRKELGIDLNSSSKSESLKLSKTGKIVLSVTAGVFCVGVYAVTVPFIAPALRKVCLPFVPATNQQIQNVLLALKGRSGTLLDIGSGDGRIVIQAAKQGFRAHGVELNPWLVMYSKINAWRHGVRSSTLFIRQDLWKMNVHSYNNIVIFGVEQMMDQLKTKLTAEVNSDVNIVACRFPLPGWEPVLTVGTGIDTVWLYKMKSTR